MQNRITEKAGHATGEAPGGGPAFSTSTHPAKALRSLGYSVVSVVPPGVSLAPSTSLSPETRGKVPGVKGQNGWKGYSWRNGRPSRQAVAKIVEDDASVGVRAKTTPGLDLDVDDPQLAHVIEKEALEFLGDAPVRLSREPRRLLVYRTDEPISKMVCELHVEPTPEAGFEGGTHKVELLGAGQQYVVHGSHPSGSEYSWQGSPLWEYAPEDLTTITAEQVADFFDHLRARFEGSAVSIEVRGSGSSRPAPSQEDLVAPEGLDQLRAVVEEIPNDYEDRETYVNIGIAVKASLPGDEAGAFEVWSDWADRWEQDTNDPETLRKDWRGFNAPYRLGFPYLQGLATERGDYNPAQDAFDADPDKSMDVPEPSEEQETNLVARYAEPLEEIEYSGPPGFLVDRLILASDINFIAGDGGSMKTTGALAIAAAVASGSPVFGHEVPEEPRRVLYVSEEDDKDQLKNKADAIAAGCGFKIPAGHLEILAQRGFTFGHDKWRNDMREHVRAGGYGLVVFDPLIEMQEGKENSNDDARPVIKFLRSITAQRGPAVIVIHHAGKGSEGKSKIDRYMRGASAYKNGARSVLGFKETKDGFLIDPLAMRRVKTPEPTAVKVEIETDPEDEHGIRWKTASFEGAPRWKVEREAAEEDIKTILNVDGMLNSGELRKAVVGAGHKPPVYSKARRSLERRGEIEYEPGDHGAKLWRLATPEEAFTAESDQTEGED